MLVDMMMKYLILTLAIIAMILTLILKINKRFLKNIILLTKKKSKISDIIVFLIN